MQWVIDHLKSIFRREKMIGTRTSDLRSDAKSKVSNDFSKQRVPQLKQAIEVLENYKPEAKKEVRKKQVTTNQLNIFQ